MLVFGGIAKSLVLVTGNDVAPPAGQLTQDSGGRAVVLRVGDGISTLSASLTAGAYVDECVLRALRFPARHACSPRPATGNGAST